MSAVIDIMIQLVMSLVICRIDYCNSVLVGIPASILVPLQKRPGHENNNYMNTYHAARNNIDTKWLIYGLATWYPTCDM